MMTLRHAWIAVVGMGMVLALGGRAAADATTAPSTPRPALQPADIPAPKLGPDGQMDAHFKKLHESFLLRRSQGPIGVLFLGDSITEGWSGRGKRVWDMYYSKLDAVNFGISGDRTQHVLWRIENGELDGISPKVVVLMIGTNNIIGYPAEDVLKADELIVQRIHEKLPDAKVLLLGIFPRGASADDPRRAKIKTVNAGLATLDDGNKTRFLDIGSKFLNDDGSLPRPIMPDFLHPAAAGYQIWADAMAPLLDDMLK
ncbi:MAG: platelet-activating factor acetylhydrolase IB subunit [Tepidisphaeraceae bacterium]|jgi:lysophospholipase L1-like esterase